MFAFKKKYFLIIENTKDINLNKIKTNHKLFIIYRNSIKSENLHNLYKFRKICSIKKIKFVIANNIKLNVLLKTDGIYLSSYNKSFRSLFFKDKGKDNIFVDTFLGTLLEDIFRHFIIQRIRR